MRAICGALGSGRFALELSVFGEWGEEFPLLLLVASGSASASSGSAL